MTLQTEFHIGNVIRNAIVFNARHWDGTIINSDTLLDAVAKLFALLDQKDIDYVLVGGIALLKYIEGRNTEDIDLIMALASLEQLPEIEIIEQDEYFARGQFQGLQIDILLTTNPLFAEVQKNFTTPQPFVEQTIQTATVNGLLLLKLYALPSLYRHGNFAKVGIYENDIATLLHYYQTDTDALTKKLANYLSSTDLAKVETIIADIQKRIERFQQKPK
jgi:hypothetical protein